MTNLSGRKAYPSSPSFRAGADVEAAIRKDALSADVAVSTTTGEVPPVRIVEAGKIAAVLRAVFEANLPRLVEEAALLYQSATAGPAAERSADPPLRSTGIDKMLASALARGRQVTSRMEDDPDFLSAEAFAAIFNVSVPSIHNWRKSGRALGLQMSSRKVWFPKVQLDSTGRRLIGGLAELHRIFDGDDWAVFRFLTTRQPGLQDLTGRDALLALKLESVLSYARNVHNGDIFD